MEFEVEIVTPPELLVTRGEQEGDQRCYSVLFLNLTVHPSLKTQPTEPL